MKLNLFYFLKKIGFTFSNYPPPFFLAIEPTNFCNLKCPACPSGTGQLTRKKGYMDIELFENIIIQQKKCLINIILHFQGEPLLHPKLSEMIGFANKNKIYTMFSTNAQILANNITQICESGLDKIIISLDGLTQETYNKYRVNGDITKVFDALQKLSELDKKYRPEIELQFLVFRHNEHEISKLKELKKQFEIDKITIKTVQIYSNQDISLLPLNQKYSRYIVDIEEHIKLKIKIKNKCFRFFSGSVITWDGDVVPCCFDKDANHKMGNLKAENFSVIWNSDNYNNFRDLVFSHRDNIDICKNCTEGLKYD